MSAGDQNETNPHGKLSPDLHTAMAHFYRGEMNRLTVWHVRLDTTTNWAILLTTGMTTFTLGSQNTPHYVLLLGLAVIGMCLAIETRRFQHVHRSAYRLRLLEVGFLRGALLGGADADWREQLGQELARPGKTISWLAAARVRLRRNYLMLVYFNTAVWLTKLYIHPTSPVTLSEFYNRLALGDLVPSWFVAGSAVVFVTTATHPDEAVRLLGSYGTWWNSIRATVREPVRYIIGDSRQPVARLTASDWWPSREVNGAASATSVATQDAIRRTLATLAAGNAVPETSGHWKLHAAEEGHYQIKLAMLPPEADEAERRKIGQLKAGVVHVRTGKREVQMELLKGATAVTLRMDLNAGDLDLEAWFTGQLPDSHILGAFFAEIERLGPRKLPDFELDIKTTPKK